MSNAWKVIVLDVSEDQMRVRQIEQDIQEEDTAILFAKHWTKQSDEDNRINTRQVAFVLEDSEDEYGHIIPKSCKFVRTIVNGVDCNG